MAIIFPRGKDADGELTERVFVSTISCDEKLV
jgi:hypothetical protein